MSSKKRKQTDNEAAILKSEDDDHSSMRAEELTGDKSQQQSRLRKDGSQRRSLFVHSLPVSATEESLKKFFSQSSALKHATVILDSVTKVSKGYGFVTYADPSDALAAIPTFNGADFDGKKIKVELAEPRSRAVQANDAGCGTTAKLSAPVKTAKAHHNRQQDQDQPSTQLIIRNLPWSINDEEKLALLFKSFGKVKRTAIPKKPHGLSAGFGFVVLRGRKNAEKALNDMNGKVVDGRTLAVDWAVRKDLWASLHPSKEDSAADGETAPQSNYDSEGIEVDEEDLEAAPESADGEDESEVNSLSDDDDSDAIDSDQIDDTHQSRNEQSYYSTLFVRNVPFTVTDESLNAHFSSFGSLRYARVVVDPATQRSKGSAFVCFMDEADAVECLKAAPRAGSTSTRSDKAHVATSKQPNKKSILEDTGTDAAGRFTMDGRILQLSRAVDKGEATRLTVAGHTFREVRDRDKRRLYLLGEGTVPSNTTLHNQLAPSEVTLREESAKQRQNLMRNNPALHLSLTRLSVRNLPRNITSKDLKALAREAVVGFSRDVKAGLRQALSKEELSRAGDLMREAERARKARGKGIVKQSKVVFESMKGEKVSEGSGVGRSKGYGFIEYTSHRWALMGLRWLNGHAVEPRSKATVDGQNADSRKKRLIVEFAIENAQVVGRRQERETQQHNKPRITKSSTVPQQSVGRALRDGQVKNLPSQSVVKAGGKRKRPPGDSSRMSSVGEDAIGQADSDGLERLAKKQQIIGRKRMSRRARKSNRSIISGPWV
ncbi:MAG: hypothetical protein Q9218_004436 [Villophora microphyllina]